MTAFRKLMTFDKIFENMRLRIQAVSSNVNIGAFYLICRRIKYILKMCYAVFWFELIKQIEIHDLLMCRLYLPKVYTTALS